MDDRKQFCQMRGDISRIPVRRHFAFGIKLVLSAIEQIFETFTRSYYRLLSASLVCRQST
ncbi:MAG TPA: hypothetical protein DEX10_00145 [Betaproteobacteria bacterium]|nr:hypothetical protein [Betaproteobacteria bacterium]